MDSQQLDMIVLGGGAIGHKVAARFLDKHPRSRVAVLDTRVVPAASWAAGAMICPWTEVTAALRSDPHLAYESRWQSGPTVRGERP